MTSEYVKKDYRYQRRIEWKKKRFSYKRSSKWSMQQNNLGFLTFQCAKWQGKVSVLLRFRAVEHFFSCDFPILRFTTSLRDSHFFLFDKCTYWFDSNSFFFALDLFPLQEGYECQCCTGFAGSHCEEIDACSPSPCTNNGICVDLSQGHDGNSYQCLCPYGECVLCASKTLQINQSTYQKKKKNK